MFSIEILLEVILPDVWGLSDLILFCVLTKRGWLVSVIKVVYGLFLILLLILFILIISVEIIVGSTTCRAQTFQISYSHKMSEIYSSLIIWRWKKSKFVSFRFLILLTEYNRNNIYGILQYQILQLTSFVIMQSAKQTTPQTYSTKFYLYLYFLAFLNHGFFAGNFGTLIPYLAELLHADETQFSFIFMASTIGMGLGMLLFKYIQKNYENASEHKIMFYMGIMSAISCALFVFWQSFLGEWILTILLGATTFMIITIVNNCVVFISTQNPAWLSTAHGLYGVAALIAPQLIRILQIHIFTLNAILFASLSILFYLIPSLQQKTTPKEQGEQQKKQMKQGSLKLEILFGFAFWIYCGLEITIVGWIPSYSVLLGIKTSNQATIYCTVFWIMMTICRFALPHVPLKVSQKLKIALYSLVFFAIISLLMHSNSQYGLAAMFTVLFFGFSCSIVFPFMFSTPHEFGIKFKKEQTTNILVGTMLSSGLLTSPIGQLMKWDIQNLFLSILVLSVALLFLVFYIFKVMVSQSSNSLVPQQIELEEKILK